MNRAWLLAIRPKTLSMAVVPVAVGAVLAVTQGFPLSGGVLLATLFASVLIQVATNLFNDAFDGQRGHDQLATRLGPPRVVASGLLTATEVRRAAVLSLALVLLLGIVLVARGGWPILLIGLTGMLAAVIYSAGPRPISFGPAGELFVVLYFGIAAVAGTYYLQAGRWHADALSYGALVGLPAAAVLVVNNYRDLASDQAAGRRTLAILLGPAVTRRVYIVLVLLPLILLPLLSPRGWSWLPLVTMPWALVLAWRIRVTAPGPALNRLLVATAGYQVALGTMLCAGWWLAAA